MQKTRLITELLCRIRWTAKDHGELTRELLTSLGDAIRCPLVPLDYSGVDSPDTLRTHDFLWVRFRNEMFAEPPRILAIAGALHASLKNDHVSGFLQCFLGGVPVRSPDKSAMLIANLANPMEDPSWEFQWEPQDFIEEYDPYTYDCFMSLRELNDSIGSDRIR